MKIPTGFKAKRVLIVLLGAIGDVARALPLAVRLKKAWPESELIWAVEPASSALLKSHPAVDRLVVFERPDGFKAFLRFTAELASLKIDLVLDLQRHFKSGVTSMSTQAPYRIGFAPRNTKEFNWTFNNLYIEAADDSLPKILHYQKFGDFLGLPVMEPLEFGLAPTAQDIMFAENLLAANLHEQNPSLREVTLPADSLKYAGLIIGATWKTKVWWPDYYSSLIGQLYDKCGLCSVLIGSASEAPTRAEIIESKITVPFVDLVNKVPLDKLPALFSQMELAIGSDTGPLHIAAASNLPVVGLYGPTNPQRCGPHGNYQNVLQSTLGCVPCYSRHCRRLDRQCLRDVTPENVLTLVKRILASKTSSTLQSTAGASESNEY